ncbi:MAG: hypothetical protein H0W44_05175 [Gammaproteobacteria bacterium]|nr:hypothetical protein [Gammaproteobacteria bacterium]
MLGSILMDKQVPIDSVTMSVQEFCQLANTLDADDLAAIPIDALPELMPENILDLIPSHNRSVVENILFEINARELDQRVEMTVLFNEEVVEALMASKTHGGHMPAYKNFKQRVAELIVLYNRWEKGRDAQVRQFLLPKIREVDDLVKEFRRESKHVLHGKLILEDWLERAEQYRPQFEHAIERLAAQWNELEGSLARYFYLRLAIVGTEMEAIEKRIVETKQLTEQVQAKIDSVHRDLNALTAATGGKAQLLSQAAQIKVEQFRKQISSLLEDKRAAEVLISETDLTNWLDVVVDASISPTSFKYVSKYMDQVRTSLFGLLSHYCLLQESSALQIARNPFSQIDPQSTIRFMIKSEQFILDYFAKKKSQLMGWLGQAAADKIQGLDGIEKELLAELKKHMPMHDTPLKRP